MIKHEKMAARFTRRERGVSFADLKGVKEAPYPPLANPGLERLSLYYISISF